MRKPTPSPDHPRACGANPDTQPTIPMNVGSSPRVRGKLRLSLGNLVRVRIIPARAGQTDGSGNSPANRTDHPRACGANCLRIPSRGRAVGSSPRVRGKHSLSELITLPRRIIPARAGQTRSPVPEHRVPTDHPRACGANEQGRGDIGHAARIIPARAGQTDIHGRQQRFRSDHPRACGANFDAA